jgi:hypothetical protein
LLRKKAFGERRARSLEQLANMPRGYLDWAEDAPVPKQGAPASDAGETAWPFTLISYQRAMNLQSRLGPVLAREAIQDIDEQIDLILAKWERRARRDEKRSKCPFLRKPFVVFPLAAICGVERDLEEDELPVRVLGLLGAMEPAQGAVQAQAEGLGMAVAFLAVALFEGDAVHAGQCTKASK